MAASTWKGFLTFGLISIPIRLSPAARTERISFNQLHKECHTRLKQPLFCPTCNRMVERSEVEKGYEYEDGQYVLFTPEELDKVEPESARSMEILEFVSSTKSIPFFSIPRITLRLRKAERKPIACWPKPCSNPATRASRKSPCTIARTSSSFARATTV